MVKKAKAEEFKAICSACYQPVPVEKTRVQPGYNDTLRAYVTNYRCEKCWEADLLKTRERIAACTDPEELATGVVFFARYGVPVPGLMLEDPPAVVRGRLLLMIDRLKSGELKLRIDTRKTVPIKLPPADEPLDPDDPFGDLFGGNPFGGDEPDSPPPPPGGGLPGSWLPPG